MCQDSDTSEVTLVGNNIETEKCADFYQKENEASKQSYVFSSSVDCSESENIDVLEEVKKCVIMTAKKSYKAKEYFILAI